MVRVVPIGLPIKGSIGSKKPQAITQKTTLVPYESRDLFGTNRTLRNVGPFSPELSNVLSIVIKQTSG